MTPYIVERLAELRRHLDHLREPRFPPDLVRALEPLPQFRNVLIHEYVALDLDRAVKAMDRMAPVERFLEIVRRDEVA